MRYLLALTLAFLALPVWAGDDAGPSMFEQLASTVIEEEVMDEDYWDDRGVTQEELMVAVFDGGSPEIPPAPIPLPPSAILLLSCLMCLVTIGLIQGRT